MLIVCALDQENLYSCEAVLVVRAVLYRSCRSRFDSGSVVSSAGLAVTVAVSARLRKAMRSADMGGQFRLAVG